MDKGPPLPSKTKGQKSGKDHILDTLKNEPSLYTGVIKAAVVLVVGLGYLSQSTGDTVVVLLTAAVMLLLTFIDRSQSVGPVTYEKALGRKP